MTNLQAIFFDVGDTLLDFGPVDTLDLFEQGEDISQTAMMWEESRLLAACQKLFGSCSRAVEAAGVDYELVKQRRLAIKLQSG